MRTLIHHVMNQAREISTTLKNLGLKTPELSPTVTAGTKKPEANFRKPRSNEASEDEAENEGWPALKTSEKLTESIANDPETKQKEKIKTSSFKRATSRAFKLLSTHHTNKNRKNNDLHSPRKKPEEIIKRNFSDARFTLIQKGEGVRFYKAPYISSVR